MSKRILDSRKLPVRCTAERDGRRQPTKQGSAGKRANLVRAAKAAGHLRGDEAGAGPHVLELERIISDLGQEVEGVMREGETVLSFITSVVLQAVARRRTGAEFTRRGLEARTQSEKSFTAESVHADLRRMLADAKKRLAR